MGGAELCAVPRAWRAPDLPRSERRGRLTASRILRPALTLLALLEAIAVAVHFEDVDVVGEPIEQRAGQPLGPPPPIRPMTKAGSDLRSLNEDSGRMQHGSPILCRGCRYACGDLPL